MEGWNHTDGASLTIHPIVEGAAKRIDADLLVAGDPLDVFSPSTCQCVTGEGAHRDDHPDVRKGGDPTSKGIAPELPFGDRQGGRLASVEDRPEVVDQDLRAREASL